MGVIKPQDVTETIPIHIYILKNDMDVKSIDYFLGSENSNYYIENVIEKFQHIKEVCENAGYWNINFHTIYYNDFESEIILEGTRKETEAESTARVRKDRETREYKATQKAKKEEHERSEYKRLHKKFGKL